MNNNSKQYQKRRNHDTLIEENIRKLADKIYEENHISISRVDDKEQQKHGIDLIVHDKQDYLVDEKSAANYAHTHLQTFAFEIRTNNNMNCAGWFDKENTYMLTQYYSLIYPYAPQNTDDLKTVDEMEILFVSKEKIWKFLENNGLYNANQAIRLLKRYGKEVSSHTLKKVVYKYNNNIKIVQSLSLYPEQPINIIINRNVLRNLSTKVLTS